MRQIAVAYRKTPFVLIMFPAVLLTVFTGRSYGQSCEVPACPTMTISGPDKVQMGQKSSYTLSGASSGNIKWSVDNPYASISGDDRGAVLAANSACSCNNGKIRITARDSQTGCKAKFDVQAGTWVNIFVRMGSTLGCYTCGGSVQCQHNGTIVGDHRYYIARARLIDIGGCAPQSAWDSGYNDYLKAGGLPCNADQGSCSRLSSVNMFIDQWKCPSPSPACPTTCSLAITDFSSSSSTLDPYFGTICLSGMTDSNDDVTWTIEIKDATGNIVRSFQGGNAVSATWDGKDDSGNVVTTGIYKVELTAMTGQCADSREISITVKSSDLKITGFTGTNILLNPSSGGTVALNGTITDSSGKPIIWTVTVAGRTYEGTGKDVSVIWDGKDSSGRVLETGDYTVTLSARTDDGSGSDSEPLQFKVLPPEPNSCGRYVQFGSSADVASGNLSHIQELFETRGAGLSTNMTLYYNSVDSNSGQLGIGWSHNYDITLKENSDGSVLLKEGNWKRKLYEADNGAYASQPGDYSTLTKNTNGMFSITHKDGSKYNFNTLGRISSLTDRNGNTMFFTYTDGDLTAVKDSSGRVTTLAYDPVGRITGITDPNGNTYTLGYINDMLAYIIYPNGGRWDYTYDASGFMLSKTDPNGYTTTYTYNKSHRVATSTDAEGRIKSITYPPTDDISPTKTTTVTEKDGGVWTYTYDTQNGTLTRKADPQGGVQAIPMMLTGT